MYTVLENAMRVKINTKHRFDAMNPVEKCTGKFLPTFKVSKKHQEGIPPPERPIVITCGSITAKIGQYVQAHLKQEYSTLYER